MKTAAYAVNAGRQVAKAGCGLVHWTANLADVQKDARRTIRKTWHATEDFLDDMAVTVKRKPLKSVGVTFGLAFGVGALAGWLGTRR